MHGADTHDGGGRAGTVLVVAASAELRRALRPPLERHGHRVLEAEHAGAALDAGGGRPDAVVADAAAARAWPSSTAEAAPLIVVVGAGGDGFDVAAAYDVLATPVRPEELVVRVAAALRVGALRAEVRRRDRDVELLTRTDPLTGLSNRRHLDEQLWALGASALRHGHPLAALMVDIDDFHRVNEAGGHVFGDAVLCVVAARLASTKRLEDVLGRWGGEEFLVLLPFTDVDRAGVVAERLRGRVGGEPVRLGEGPEVPVTVSVGVAAGDGSDPEAIVRSADVALYYAKQNGRDRVERSAWKAPAPG